MSQYEKHRCKIITIRKKIIIANPFHCSGFKILILWKLAHCQGLNRAESLLLATHVLFPLWQIKMAAVKKELPPKPKYAKFSLLELRKTENPHILEAITRECLRFFCHKICLSPNCCTFIHCQLTNAENYHLGIYYRSWKVWVHMSKHCIESAVKAGLSTTRI